MFWLIGVRNSNCRALRMPTALSIVHVPSLYFYLALCLRRISYFVMFKRKVHWPIYRKNGCIACLYVLFMSCAMCVYYEQPSLCFFFRFRFVSLYHVTIRKWNIAIVEETSCCVSGWLYLILRIKIWWVFPYVVIGALLSEKRSRYS